MKFEPCFVIFLLIAAMAVPFATAQKSSSTPDLAQLQQMTSRFAPTSLRVDTSKLSSGDRQALVKLIEASRILNTVFMKQFWSGNIALYGRLQKDNTPLGKARLHYFGLNKGPWSDIDAFKAFIPGVPAVKPKGANFYPEDMTSADFEKWIKDGAADPPDPGDEGDRHQDLVGGQGAGRGHRRAGHTVLIV